MKHAPFEFSVEDGIRIQSEQLARWKTVLRPKVYDKLEEYARQDNRKAETGFDICRGTDLDQWVSDKSQDLYNEEQKG